MFEKPASCVEKFADEMGVKIKVPRPTKRSLRASTVSNTIVGAGLIVAGVVFSSKALTVLGIFGLAGAAALHSYLEDEV